MAFDSPLASLEIERSRQGDENQSSRHQAGSESKDRNCNEAQNPCQENATDEAALWGFSDHFVAPLARPMVVAWKVWRRGSAVSMRWVTGLKLA
jgi:hypothetical protein